MQAPPFAHDVLNSPPAVEDSRDRDAEDAERPGHAGLADPPARPGPPRRRPTGGGERTASPHARMTLARARIRALVPLDVVTFVAACPACGRDCEWTQEREETRVRSVLNCSCAHWTPPLHP